MEKELDYVFDGNLYDVDKLKESKYQTFLNLKQRLSELDKQVMKVNIFPVKPHFKNKKILQFVVQTPEVHQISQNTIDQSRVFIDRGQNAIIFNMGQEIDVDNPSIEQQIVNIVFDVVTKSPPTMKKIENSQRTKQQTHHQSKSLSSTIRSTVLSSSRKQKPAQDSEKNVP
jgi:hypothetical protein